jgi:hypothetical protein
MRRHKKRAGEVERDTARVFYMRLSQVRLKIQFNGKRKEKKKKKKKKNIKKEEKRRGERRERKI